ncbi:DUF4330 domain-containing protein [bacterium]|nr:DUF4330 domain-containing protein [bacterium]
MRNKWVIGAVLALLIVAGVAVAYKLTRPSQGAKELSGKRIEATFLAYEIQPATADQIKEGSTIYDQTGKACFTITKVTVTPAQEVGLDSTGVLHATTHPILKDVVITADSIGPKVAWAYMFGTDKILAGANVAIYGDLWKVWTRVLTVHDLP